MDDANHPRRLLPARSQNTPGQLAASIRWAMDDMLAWDVPAPHAGMVLLRTQDELASTWASHGGAPGNLPTIDFSRFMVAAIFLDAGSYHRCPGIRTIDHIDGRIIVSYAQTSRPWKMTNPCSVIRVPRADGAVEFREIAG
jgi:hypothetical protein